MIEQEQNLHINPSRGVRFEQITGLTRQMIVEPGILPIIRNTVGNFKIYPVGLKESLRQEEEGTGRRFEISCFYEFPLDFIQGEISSSVDTFFKHMDTGQDRAEAGFSTSQSFSKARLAERYSAFYVKNQERIFRETFPEVKIIKTTDKFKGK